MRAATSSGNSTGSYPVNITRAVCAPVGRLANWAGLRFIVPPSTTIAFAGSVSISTYDLTAFALGGGSLGNYLLSTSATTAMGGAIAYRYATTGSTDSLGAESIALVLSEASFGIAAQSIFPALSGTEADDYLTGTDSADKMYGRGGNDFLLGGEGADTLDGGAGNDVLLGEAGDDILISGAGSDFANGGDGNDTYIFGIGSGEDSFFDFPNDAGTSTADP